MRHARATSEYLNRPLRSIDEVLAWRLAHQSRLAEIHACLDRAETEAHRIADEHPGCTPVCTTFNDLAEAMDELRQDYLKPAEQELRWAEEAEDEG